VTHQTELDITRAVITAAGRGTRLRPATLAVQKELFPLVDRDGVVKPVIQIIVEEAVAAGIREVCVVVSPEDEAAFAEFLGASALGAFTSLAVQPTPEGSGHAIWHAQNWLAGAPFLLLLGDHVYVEEGRTLAMAQVMDSAKSAGTSVWGVQRLPEARIGSYGVVAGQPDAGGYVVERILEKPTVEEARASLVVPGVHPDYLGIFGIYALTPAYMDCLDALVSSDVRHGGEIQLTSALAMLLEREPVRALEVRGRRYDMGNPLGLMETQMALAMRSPLRQELLDFVSVLTAGESSA
jgi:UTP--glucose-1-phosphate uridylyltransferase